MSEGTGERTKFQARHPSEIDKEKGTRRNSLIRRLTLAGILTIGGGVAINQAINSEPDPIRETYSTLNGKELKLNGSELKFDGEKVRFRSEPYVPDKTDVNVHGNDTLIENGTVVKINGTDWDGHSSFTAENIPFISGEDPTHRMGEAPWLVFEIQTDSGDQSLAFVSKSGATSSWIDTVTKGDVAEIKFDKNNKLEATFDSGKTITEGEIGKIEIKTDPQLSS